MAGYHVYVLIHHVAYFHCGCCRGFSYHSAKGVCHGGVGRGDDLCAKESAHFLKEKLCGGANANKLCGGAEITAEKFRGFSGFSPLVCIPGEYFKAGEIMFFLKGGEGVLGKDSDDIAVKLVLYHVVYLFTQLIHGAACLSGHLLKAEAGGFRIVFGEISFDVHNVGGSHAAAHYHTLTDKPRKMAWHYHLSVELFQLLKAVGLIQPFHQLMLKGGIAVFVGLTYFYVYIVLGGDKAVGVLRPAP